MLSNHFQMGCKSYNFNCSICINMNLRIIGTKQTLPEKKCGIYTVGTYRKTVGLFGIIFQCPTHVKLRYLFTCFVPLNIIFLRFTKQVWIWTQVGDRLKIACQDEEEGFLLIGAYPCCNPHPKICWNTQAVWLGHCQS